MIAAVQFEANETDDNENIDEAQLQIFTELQFHGEKIRKISGLRLPKLELVNDRIKRRPWSKLIRTKRR